MVQAMVIWPQVLGEAWRPGEHEEELRGGQEAGREQSQLSLSKHGSPVARGVIMVCL